VNDGRRDGGLRALRGASLQLATLPAAVCARSRAAATRTSPLYSRAGSNVIDGQVLSGRIRHTCDRFRHSVGFLFVGIARLIDDEFWLQHTASPRWVAQTASSLKEGLARHAGVRMM